MYTKSELECKLWALGEMTCQNRFPKCTTMAGDADRGEDGTCVGTEGIWELYFLLSSTVNLIETIFKKKEN